MRIGKRHKQIIKQMECDGYIWLSHLHINAQMRFRNRRRAGFEHYFKLEGLVFLTKRIAEALSRGCKTPDTPRLTFKEQIVELENELIELEKEVYDLRGVGEAAQTRRFRDED